jgi:hypothetical protein
MYSNFEFQCLHPKLLKFHNYLFAIEFIILYISVVYELKLFLWLFFLDSILLLAELLFIITECDIDRRGRDHCGWWRNRRGDGEYLDKYSSGWKWNHIGEFFCTIYVDRRRKCRGECCRCSHSYCRFDDVPPLEEKTSKHVIFGKWRSRTSAVATHWRDERASIKPLRHPKCSGQSFRIQEFLSTSRPDNTYRGWR